MMFVREDNTYNDIRKKSFNQWLNEMESHEDIAVRGGVTLARQYVEYLEKTIGCLEESNKLKDEYLKKIKGKK